MVSDGRSQRLPRGVDRGLAWALAGFVIYIVGYMAALLPMSVLERAAPVVGLAPEVGTFGWGVFLGVYAIAWGAIVLAAAAWIGLRIVPGLRPGRPSALLVAAVGLGLAAVTEVALHEFVRARFGEFAVRAAGFALFAGPAMVAASTAGWAALAAPRSLSRPLAIEVVLSGIALAAATLPGVPGVRDGISPSGWPMATALALDAVFVTVVAVRVLIRRD